VALFAELGLYRLLLALRSTAELESFYEQALGALVEYDRKNDGELLKTLDAYFACLGSPTEAAERLHVHRNTLLYRLHRIQEIAGVDLSDAETRLALHLALRVREVLQVGPQDADGPVRSAQTAAV
jgi:PucR family transcriptional regulator, purine catabolism regulatory protein